MKDITFGYFSKKNLKSQINALEVINKEQARLIENQATLINKMQRQTEFKNSVIDAIVHKNKNLKDNLRQIKCRKKEKKNESKS
jgi:hypothetical protein